MKILVDENIPNVTVNTLQELGHDVIDVRGTIRQGCTDDALWNLAQAEERMFITTDKGYAEYRDLMHHGMLIIRLRQPNESRIHERVLAALRQFSEKEWPGLLVVMRDFVQSISRAR